MTNVYLLENVWTFSQPHISHFSFNDILRDQFVAQKSENVTLCLRQCSPDAHGTRGALQGWLSLKCDAKVGKTDIRQIRMILHNNQIRFLIRRGTWRMTIRVSLSFLAKRNPNCEGRI
ncbi:hypothetical protein NPIL_535111 [Nephila pilipes]|uniref:Uncharacterized protein n=1 Tax=Nephila pilipes TaxID=299642 RepID=A0A8X6Q4U4_NEPPI|nr:hypothetical protein NPIL_535111 [Nephila pilipes]